MCTAAVVALAVAGCEAREPIAAAAGPLPSSVASSKGSPRAGTAAPACASTYFAANQCKAGGACVGIFEVTPACTVRRVNELRVSAFADHVVDLAWPTLDGPLYVVTSRDPDGASAWGRVEHPRTATDAELTAMTWTTETFGKPEPGGFSLGVETDGTRAILTGCAKWIGDEEEWSCVKRVHRTTDKTAVTRLPPPAYATAWKPGDVLPGVALRARRHDHGDSLECRTATGEWTDAFHTTPIAVAPIAGARWYLFYETAADRSQPNIGIAAIAMTGCMPDDTLGRIATPGPDGLSAHSPDDGSGEPKWKIHHRGSVAPLTDTAGSPFGLDGATTLVWTHS